MANYTTTPAKPRGDDRSGYSGQSTFADRPKDAASTVGEKAKDAANAVSEKAKDVGTAVGEKAKDFGSTVAEKAKDAASTVTEKAKDAASAVVHGAEDATSYLGHKAEDATATVGGGLKTLGHTIRENTPHDGVIGEASSAVANSLESTGRYLQEEGLKGMAEDMTNMIRRNPIPALLVGVGIGFLIARATAPRS
jgi:hypothetical protein